MAGKTFRFASALALAATVSMAATPAMARDRWGRHHHRGVDAGDVLAGVLIIGGIAAIASAANKSKREREAEDYRYRQPQSYPDDRYEYRDEPRSVPRGNQVGGIDSAVDSCVGEVERGQDRVASVDNASRTSNGWQISGQLAAGGGFSCWIDNDGRIRNVDIGSSYSSYDAPAGSQWDDEAYARARAQRAGTGEPYGESAPYGEIDGDL